MGHDVCDIMGASVTVKTGYVDEVIDSLSVSGQCTVLPATNLAEVYTVLAW